MAQQPLLLDLADCHDASLVGGKAINLAHLIGAGFPVPGGFVVTTEAFKQAAADDWSVPTSLKDDIAARLSAMGTPPVAVRSSATAEDLADASMAGQYETYLDIEGADAVVDCIEQCWKSVDTPRTQSYLKEHGIAMEEVAMAVVVQRLIPADAAGVLFTANPRTGSREEMLIEASWGLGEAVVSGIVQPDTLTLDRATGAIKECVIGSKEIWIEPGSHEERATAEEKRGVPCLTSQQVHDLFHVGQMVREHFGSAQDMEWAICNDEIFLLQSRAVTTLEDAELLEHLLAETRKTLRASMANGRGPWVRHNLGETLPHPTPLTWSVIGRFMSGAGGFGEMYRMAGFDPSEQAKKDGFLDLVGGRIYMDCARGPEMFFADFPYAYDLNLLERDPEAAQGAPTVPTGSLIEQVRVSGKLTRAAGTLKTLSDGFDKRLETEFVPAFSAWVEDEKQRDLTALSGAEWKDLWETRKATVLGEFAPRSLLPSLIVGMALEELRAFVQEHFWDDEPDDLVERLCTGLTPDSTVRANAALRQVALGEMTVDDWLARYGHRAPEEFDLAAPRWREQPDAVKQIASHLKDGLDPEAMHEKRKNEADALTASMTEKLAPCVRDDFQTRVALARRYVRWREDGKYHLMQGYDLLRDMALEAGRRLDIGEDVFLLTEEELFDALAIGIAPLHLLETRREERGAEARLRLPHTIAEEDIVNLGSPAKLDATGAIPAFSISAGRASGPARIVFSPQEAGDLGKGYILVCPSTDPNWTPLFVNAAGLVLERGGSLSHGAVVAREMGIPAVVMPDATSLLADGETVTIDGHGGALVRGEAHAEDIAGSPDADPDNVTVAWNRTPPPPGLLEERSALVRNVFLGVWAIVLALVFLLPQPALYHPIIRGFDVFLWPLVGMVGKPGTVALIAAVVASLTMIGQRLLTDNRRLQTAKQRSNDLKKEAATLPPASPRRKALQALAAPVQTRITMAAFVPLAVVLGPMIMSFMWLTERVDPAVRNPNPGSTVLLTAQVDGEYTNPVKLKIPETASLSNATPVTQSNPPIRATLEELLGDWRRKSDLSALPWEARAAAVQTREAMLADLGAYLKRDIPPQPVSWNLRLPDKAGHYEVTLAVEDASAEPFRFLLVQGNEHPPEPTLILGEADHPIREVKIVYDDGATKDDTRFWSPFLAFGWKWDAGWLLTYLAAYLPVMFGLKFLLRIP